MPYLTPKLSRTGRQHPLAACVAALVSMTAPAIALCVAVTNCNDVGPNSLRAAVTNTATGGTIDMTSLTCSTITLEDSQIVIGQQDLTIKGPASGVTIAHDGNYDRVLNHQGSGTLTLQSIRVTGGDLYSSSQDIKGGCIYSKGNVSLTSSSVSNCLADSHGHAARGGGLYTRGNLSLDASTIAGNTAGSQYSFGEGGGAHVGGNLEIVDSAIRNNSAISPSGFSSDGGVGVDGSFDITYSTISGNTADFVGGLGAFGRYFTGLMDGSTVSGNHARQVMGGMYVRMPTTIRNSTIAFNSATAGKVLTYYSPGLTVGNLDGTITIDLESSILSNNTYLSNSTTIENDFGIVAGTAGSVTVSGQHNLVVASFVTFPSNVVTTMACPLLGPLRENGGVTQTHALLSHSPAIDTGSNPVLEQFDQRGPPYKRSDGIVANFTDIGAYEVQQEDIVFNAGFDGCP